MPPYCTAQNVADLLGKQLTAAQLAEAATLAISATSYVDRICKRTWQNTGTVLGELQAVEGPFIYLTHRPVTAINAITARNITVGNLPYSLVAGTDYELLDPARGMLSMLNWWSLWLSGNIDWIRDQVGSQFGKLLSVDYTTSEAVPADIQTATAMIVAAWLQPTFSTGMSGFKQIAIAGSVSVTVADQAIPPHVTEILSGYRRTVFA